MGSLEIYKCPTPKCSGQIVFGEKKPKTAFDDRLEMIILTERPSKCMECGKSYYKRECVTKNET
jgi:hypothetical protein